MTDTLESVNRRRGLLMGKLMNGLQVFECVFCLLAVRVGLPGLLLVTLGFYLTRWQSNRQPT